ncbi:lactose-specific PTS transporter subunit EIIC [Streptococcus catagoni]|uniref:lactose-specific PTS transporter subunit EIIC n=1 Tax=Streptococcus catagoni TaxID=2654874 RepID=UPI00140A78FD|nr:lactose-specific PTS transporter subunit EIIC [Streptococcus catagoni]
MNTIISALEKQKPFFEKLSRNIYLRAIRDGFIAIMPITLFASLFLLIANIPQIFGFVWPEEIKALIVKPYSYTMGILALLVTGTTAKSLTDSMNVNLKLDQEINYLSTMIASICGFLILASDQISQVLSKKVSMAGFSSANLGTTGLLSAFIAAFVVVNVYKFCMKHNITIEMPAEVPPNISRVFKDLFAFSFAILVLYALDIAARSLLGVNVAQSVSTVLAPLFSYADGIVGVTIIFGAYALFWFIGIHGPSIVEPAIISVIYSNVETNYNLIQSGQHTDKFITTGVENFIVTMGGTGATLVVPFIFMWLGKSERNKAIGRASVIPTFFGVNEPILFGGPLVLNPIFFIPFVFAPIANIWIFKFFIDILKMDSFSYILPWTTPAPIGIIIGTGFQFLSFVLPILLIIVDTLIYYPFFKLYDEQILEEERKGLNATQVQLKEKVLKNFDTKKTDSILEKAGVAQVEEQRRPDQAKTETSPKSSEQATVHSPSLEASDPINVLVLCAGGGTSGLLANALNKAAKENQEAIQARAGSYGSHREILPHYDIVVLAPQVASNYEDMKRETDKLGIKLVKTEGLQYIALTRDGKGSIDFIKEQLDH